MRLAHRGPDGAGIFTDRALGFAHRRLSIIDLATGDQPMERRDLGRAIVFNGEIYNYLELRAELIEQGHAFHTQSDTEVLLVGHAAWGEALLPRLRGMFAFALGRAAPAAHRGARSAAARSHCKSASCPASCSRSPPRPRRSSALPELSRTIRPEAIAAYLDWMYVPEQLALYRDIERLQAGEVLVVEEGRARRARYAADAAPQVRAGISFEEACARVDAAVREATRIRLRADVPLGVFLSGGIDSTLVALAAASQLPGKLRTYTVGFPARATSAPTPRRWRAPSAPTPRARGRARRPRGRPRDPRPLRRALRRLLGGAGAGHVASHPARGEVVLPATAATKSSAATGYHLRYLTTIGTATNSRAPLPGRVRRALGA